MDDCIGFIFEAIFSLIGLIFKLILSLIGAIIGAILGVIAGLIAVVWEVLCAIAKAIFEGILGLIAAIFNWIGEAIAAIFNWIAGLFMAIVPYILYGIGIILAVFLAIGVLKGFVNMLSCFRIAINWAKEKEVPANYKDSYLTGAAFFKVRAYIADSFSLFATANDDLKPKKLMYSVATIFTYIVGTLLLGVLSVLLFTPIIVFNVIRAVIVFAVYVPDKILTYVRHIGYRCPKCKRLTGLPVFQCPQCGTLHKNLRPGAHGIFHVKCQCGTSLSTTCFNGRSKLKAFCPYCNESFAHGGASQFGIQIAGAVSSGKTTFLAAFWHEYSNILKRSFDINYTTSPKKSFDKLETWYRQGLSNATIEMNARMYSIIHNFKDNKTPLQLSFYDIAGEAFNRLGDDVQQQQFQYCEGVILLIDPSMAPAKTHESIANFIFEIKKLKGIAADSLIDIPVAAVISKSDLHRREIGLLRINREADSRPDTDKALIQNEICRKFLQAHGFVSVLNLIDSTFTNVKFFPVSAMGHEADGSEYSSWGVLSPVFWIIEQKNPAFHSALMKGQK